MKQAELENLNMILTDKKAQIDAIVTEKNA